MAKEEANDSGMPDLSTTPKASTMPVRAEMEMEDDLLDATSATLNPDGDMDTDALAAKALLYEQKLMAGDGDQSLFGSQTQTQPNEKVLTTVKEENPEEKEQDPPSLTTPKHKKKGKGKNALSDAAFSAWMNAKTSAASRKVDVKPISGPSVPSSAGVMDTGAQWTVEASTPKIGDEEFPEVQVPAPSQDYAELSAMSSQYEDVANDMSEISSRQKDTLSAIGEINIRLAKMEKRMQEIETDKSQFMSNMLDNLRRLERKIGNSPPLAVPAASLAVPVSAPIKTDPGPKKTSSELLALVRASRKK